MKLNKRFMAAFLAGSMLTTSVSLIANTTNQTGAPIIVAQSENKETEEVEEVEVNIEIEKDDETMPLVELVPSVEVEVVPTVMDEEIAVEVVPTVELEEVLEVAPTVELEAVVEVAPTVELEAVVEVAPTVELEAEIEVAPIVELEEVAVEVISPVEYEVIELLPTEEVTIESEIEVLPEVEIVLETEKVEPTIEVEVEIALINKIETILENVEIVLTELEGVNAEAAQNAVTHYITDLLEGTGITAIIEGQGFTPPVAGNEVNPSGTVGNYQFIVALIDNDVTATTNMLSAQIPAIDYVAPVVVDTPPSEVEEQAPVTLDSVIAFLENDDYDLLQKNANTIEDAKAEVLKNVNFFLEGTDITASIKGYGFTTAIEGNEEAPMGTDGYYKFIIELTDGDKTVTTNIINAPIIAFSSITPEQVELNNLISELTETLFTIESTDAKAAGVEIKNKLEVILADSDAIATIKGYEFKEAVAGTPDNENGINGVYKFSIELVNGNALVTTEILTAEILADKYEAPVMLQNLIVKGLTFSNLEFNGTIYDYSLNIAQADQGKNFILTPVVTEGVTTTVSVPEIQEGISTGVAPVTVGDLVDGSQIIIEVSEGDRTSTYTITIEMADNSLLEEPILEAQEVILTPVVSVDGSDVDSDMEWVNSNARYEYNLAINKARELFFNTEQTTAQIETAVAELEAATETFKNAVAMGTKATSLEILNISVAGDVEYDSSNNTIDMLNSDMKEFTVTIVAKNSDVIIKNSVNDKLSDNGILALTVPADTTDFNIALSNGNLTSQPINFTVNHYVAEDSLEETMNAPVITDAELLAALSAMGVKYSITMEPIAEEVKTEGVKAEEVKVEEVKAEEVKAEEVKTEGVKTEAIVEVIMLPIETQEEKVKVEETKFEKIKIIEIEDLEIELAKQ